MERSQPGFLKERSQGMPGFVRKWVRQMRRKTAIALLPGGAR